jgi:putative ABC transport system permease protein
MPAWFGFPSNQQLWTPLSNQHVGAGDDAGTLWGVGRLKRGVTMSEAEAQLVGIGRRLVLAHPESSQTVTVSIEPYSEFFVDSSGRIMLWIMLLVVSFVLVIAAANVANLLLSRAVVRSKQVAIRMALGAGRVRVILLLLMESLVLAVLGGVGGLLLSWGAVGWFNRTLGPEVDAWWVIFGVDRAALLFTAACVAGATLLAGIVPALQASGIDLQAAMRSESAGTTGFRQGRISRVLVVGQLTLSCALLILSGLMVRGVAQMEAFEPGFDPAGVVTGRVDLESFDYPDLTARQAFAEEMEARLREIPGVEGAALSTSHAGLGAGSTFYSLDTDVDPDGRSRLTTELNHVSPGFFAFYRMSLQDGRLFDDGDRDVAERVVVVNDAMAERLAPGESVVGRQLFLGREPRPEDGIRIVGVIQDQGVSVREGRPYPGIFLPLWDEPLTMIRMAVRTHGKTTLVTPAVREVLAALDPNLPFHEVSTLQADLDHLNIAERTFGILFGVFGISALILAVVGLYGVIAFSVNRRARELGVRRALGASPKKILWTTFGDGLGPLGLGLALGIGLAWLLAPLLGEALFGSDPQDPLVFSLIPLTLALASGLGLWIPSRRASRTDPMMVLRTE